MTTDPFDRHFIKHLSPSSLRLWRENPAAWIAKYLLRASDEAGPSAWRGRAVEAGVDRLVFGDNIETATQSMRNQWDNQAQGLIDPDCVKEEAALGDFLMQAKAALGMRPIPLQRQGKMSLTLPGISVPLIGYCDYLWSDEGTDLKTTWRMPGTPRQDHVCQVTTYSMFYGVPFTLTYVTPKRWTRFEVTPQMMEQAYEVVLETAHALRSFLAHVKDAADALSMFSPDYSSYLFSSTMAQAVRATKAGALYLPLKHSAETIT
jgi:hypothetical protein